MNKTLIIKESQHILEASHAKIETQGKCFFI